jgi:predicted SprT family Zn-dependent metalloprotease
MKRNEDGTYTCHIDGTVIQKSKDNRNEEVDSYHCTRCGNWWWLKKEVKESKSS